MKIIEMKSAVNQEGRLVFPAEAVAAAGLKPGDNICVAMTVREEDGASCPLVLITSEGVDVAVPLGEWQEDGAEFLLEDDLHLPNQLLEAAGIPLDNDLEIICAEGAIIIASLDILERLPEDLRRLFQDLGISPDTVREVMRKDGYFDESKARV